MEVICLNHAIVVVLNTYFSLNYVLRKEDLLIKIFYLKKGTEKETDMEFLFFKVFKIELSSHLDNNLLLFDYILVWLLACSKRL